MSETTCMDCKYMTDSTGSAACAYAHGLKEKANALLFGPKPLFKTEPCEHFTYKKQQKQYQKVCTYRSEYVKLSRYNQMGACKCIECMEQCKHCFHLPMDVKCAKCREYSTKIK